MFQKRFTAREKPKPPAVITEADGIEQITSKEHIAVLLKNIQEQHALLSVNTIDNRRAYISAIIKVSPEEKCFLLDGIKPEADHHSLIKSRQFSASTRINGIKTSFSCSIESVGEDGGIPYYKVRFPSEITHEQRREFFRAAMPLGETIKVLMSNSDEVELEGQLRDLSVGGLRAEFNTSQDYHLEKGLILPVCTIKLLDDKPIISSIEVRHLINRVREKVTFFGARFIDLDKPTKRNIQYLVGQMDRKSTKNRHRIHP